MSALKSSRIFTQDLLNEPKVDHVERFENTASLSNPKLITTMYQLGNERLKQLNSARNMFLRACVADPLVMRFSSRFYLTLPRANESTFYLSSYELSQVPEGEFPPF